MSIRVRAEAGFGLVELLVAMTVMSIGIFALVAGFSSGIETNRRASKTSIAGTLADQQMEAFRRSAYASIASSSPPPTLGTDGRMYSIVSVVTLRCPDETTPTGPTCTLSDGTVSRPVKLATVTVREGSAAGSVLIAESSTFDQSTG